MGVGEHLIEAEGVIAAEPELLSTQSGTFAPFAEHRGAPTRLELIVTAATGGDAGEQAVPASGTLRVLVERGTVDFHAGDLVRVRGIGAALPGARNPGDSPTNLLGRQEGDVGRVRMDDASTITRLSRSPSNYEASLAWWRRWLSTLRARVSASLGEADPNRAEPRALLAALLLGQRDDDLRELSGAFTRLGLTHVLCVSGVNLTIFAVFLLLALRLTGDRPRIEQLIVAGVVLLYLLVIPAEAPIVRAALMLLIFIAAELLGRRYDRLNLLAYVAVLSLVWRPLDLWAPGFQLSFLGVAALLWLMRPLREKLFGPRLDPADLGGGLVGMGRRGLEWTKDGLAASLAAWGLSAPVIACHTGLFSPLAAVCGLIVMPAASIITGLGYFAVLLGCAVPGLTPALTPVLDLLARILAWTVFALDHTPGTVVHLPQLGGWLCAMLTCVAGWWMLSPRRAKDAGHTPPAPRFERTGRIAATLCAIGWLCFSLLHTASTAGLTPAESLRCDALSLPGGSCTLVRSRGEAMLYDCGSTRLDAGEREIPRTLRTLGAWHVRTVVISHADLERFSALLDVLDPLGVRQVIVNEAMMQRAADRPEGPAAFLLKQLADRGVRVRTAVSGDHWELGSATVTVLAPEGGAVLPTHGDASLVLRVTTPTAGGERSVLFMGDVRSPGFALLAERDVDLRADAVFAPEARSGAEKVSRLSGAEVVIWNHTPRGSPTHTDWPNPRQDGCTGVIVSPGGALLTAPWNATAIPDEPRTK